MSEMIDFEVSCAIARDLMGLPKKVLKKIKKSDDETKRQFVEKIKNCVLVSMNENAPGGMVEVKKDTDRENFEKNLVWDKCDIFELDEEARTSDWVDHVWKQVGHELKILTREDVYEMIDDWLEMRCEKHRD